ncbi:MAG: methyltransferase domain-containing protein [Planctomycetota bacterium]|nr:methyltransferase domain-containing protein [Planctomycetota bacterium]
MRPKLSLHQELNVQESNVLGQFIPVHYHYNMLLDEQRMEAFRSAIQAVIRPGMRVVELGGGTGVLSFLAARYGAKVWCVERNSELVKVARKAIRSNGFESMITVIHEDATEFIPPEPVDAVICEMLHVALLREKQAQVIHAFKENYRKRFGDRLPRFLPEASILTFQLLEYPFLFSGYHVPVPVFQQPTPNQVGIELSELQTYGQVIYDESIPMQFGWSDKVTASQSGQLSAIRFITQNLIAIDTEKQLSYPWPNQFLILPIDEPILVEEGQEVAIDFCYRVGESLKSLAGSIQIDQSMRSISRRIAA